MAYGFSTANGGNFEFDGVDRSYKYTESELVLNQYSGNFAISAWVTE